MSMRCSMSARPGRTLKALIRFKDRCFRCRANDHDSCMRRDSFGNCCCNW